MGRQLSKFINYYGCLAVVIVAFSNGSSVAVEMKGTQEATVEDEAVASVGLDIRYGKVNFTNYTLIGGRKLEKAGQGFGLAVEWFPLTSFGRLGAGVGVGYTFFEDVLQDQGKLSLYVIPADFFLSYRLDLSRRQLLVPFLRGGVNLALVEEKARGGSARSGMQRFFTFDVVAGMAVRLNRIDPQSAKSLENSIGIINTFLSFEYQRAFAITRLDRGDLAREEFRLKLRFEM